MSQEVNGELVPVGGGDSIPLLRTVMSIGRRESCDICMRFPNVSGLHAELVFRDGYWYLRDLNSTNGVKINGTRVQEKLVHPNDEVSIGKRSFVIHYELPGGRRAMEEPEEDVLSKPLLERAGLQKPKRRRAAPSARAFDAADFLLEGEE